MTPRLLYISTFLDARSNASYCQELADRLEAGGMAVARTSTKWRRVERLADMLATAWRLRETYDVAIVDVFSGPAFLWAEATCFLLRRLGKRYVLTLHGGNLPVFARRWPRRVRRLLASAARVTAPSSYMREQMSTYRGDIELVPNAIDTRALAFEERTRAQPRLIWVRAFHAIYNPVLAIEALAKARLPGARLAMIGPDKEDGSLVATRRRARELGVEDRVDFVGRVDKTAVHAHLARADIFLNTTNVDNTPLSVLEALSTGLCVISTRVGGIPYLLAHERTALLVPPGDAAAMAHAIERVVNEPELARELSRNARDAALAHDWASVLARWESILGEVARV